MNLYNPFKAHLVKREDKYIIRRYDIVCFRWIYLDRIHTSCFWWSDTSEVKNYAERWCALPSKELAIARLAAYRAKAHAAEKLSERRIKESD